MMRCGSQSLKEVYLLFATKTNKDNLITSYLDGQGEVRICSWKSSLLEIVFNSLLKISMIRNSRQWIL